MKALLVRPADAPDAPFCVSVIPDSAITTQGRPVTLPLAPRHWSLDLAVAFRIGRLGKAISSKFAHRYIDAVTLAVIPQPLTPEAAAVCRATAGAFDCALTLGEWLEPQCVQSQIVVDGFGSIPVPDAPAAIAAVTPWTTLKTGDIFIFPIQGAVNPETARSGISLNGAPCFRRRVI